MVVWTPQVWKRKILLDPSLKSSLIASDKPWFNAHLAITAVWQYHAWSMLFNSNGLCTHKCRLKKPSDPCLAQPDMSHTAAVCGWLPIAFLIPKRNGASQSVLAHHPRLQCFQHCSLVYTMLPTSPASHQYVLICQHMCMCLVQSSPSLPPLPLLNLISCFDQHCGTSTHLLCSAMCTRCHAISLC